MKPRQNLNPFDENQMPSGLDFTFCPRCSASLVKKQIDGMLRNCCTKCRFVQYINPLPGVAVLVEKDHHLLIGKRSKESVESGKWCLPCGFIEHGESYLEAARREVFEETGLDVDITSLVGVSSNRINAGLHTLVTVLTAKIVNGTPQAGDDLVALTWIDKNTGLPEMAFEADEYIIKKYFKNTLIRIPIDPHFG